MTSLDEILAAILPEEIVSGAPSGFTSTGHIGIGYALTKNLVLAHCLAVAHLNLNNEYLPYKHLIGQVILDVSET